MSDYADIFGPQNNYIAKHWNKQFKVNIKSTKQSFYLKNTE